MESWVAIRKVCPLRLMDSVRFLIYVGDFPCSKVERFAQDLASCGRWILSRRHSRLQPLSYAVWNDVGIWFLMMEVRGLLGLLKTSSCWNIGRLELEGISLSPITHIQYEGSKSGLHSGDDSSKRCSCCHHCISKVSSNGDLLRWYVALYILTPLRRWGRFWFSPDHFAIFFALIWLILAEDLDSELLLQKFDVQSTSSSVMGCVPFNAMWGHGQDCWGNEVHQKHARPLPNVICLGSLGHVPELALSYNQCFTSLESDASLPKTNSYSSSC